MKSILFSIAILMLVNAAFAELQCECQKRTKISPRIIGGKKTNKGEYPWLINILTEDATINFTVCHGVILNEFYILTAASCLPVDEFEQVKIKFNGIEEAKSIKNVTVHPGFVNTSDYSYENDIAIIKLNESLNFQETETIEPACLATKKVDNYKELVIVGEGSTTAVEIDEHGMVKYFRPSVNELKRAIVRDSTDLTCVGEDSKGNKIKDTTICINSREKEENSLCLGDGGSGVHKKNSKWRNVVVGIASLATHDYNEETKTVKLCTSGARAARVSAYIDWIKTIANEFCS